MVGIVTGKSKQIRAFWFTASLAFAVSYGLLAVHYAFSSDFLVADDARQHIFWMHRYVDPDLLSDDYIADYFQSVAPLGYQWLYHFVAMLGINPIVFSKIVPLFLSVITAGYSFWITLELFPIPLAAFISSLIFSQSLWSSTELASATPRGFLYPILVAFLYYLLRGNLWLSLGILALQALFYPQISLVLLGLLLLRTIHWQNWKVSFSKNRQDYFFFIAGFLLVAVIVLISKGSSDFGEIVTRSQARAMVEFQPGGRNEFFFPGSHYWLYGRSGILHNQTFTPLTIGAGLALPILLSFPWNEKFKDKLDRKIWTLIQLVVSSLGLFMLAHLFLFELHLPNRYSSHIIRTAIALVSGISWVVIFDNIFRLLEWGWMHISAKQKVENRSSVKQPVTKILSGSIAIALIALIMLYPALFIKNFPKVGYQDLTSSKVLYEYFATQPKDTLVASLAGEGGNIPYFSARSILTSNEHGMAYHKGYYSQFRQRVEDVIKAQYTTDPATLKALIEQYGIDFWLLHTTAFQPAYLLENGWIMQYQPAATKAAQMLENGEQPVMQRAIATCSVFNNESYIILNGNCVYQFASEQQPLTAAP